MSAQQLTECLAEQNVDGDTVLHVASRQQLATRPVCPLMSAWVSQVTG